MSIINYRKPIVAFDMDGVQVDYNLGLTDEYKKRFPGDPVHDPKDLNTFYIEDAYEEQYKPRIKQINTSKGFFRNLPPMKGVREAMGEILHDPEIDAYICTAPDLDCVDQVCFTEKAQWVDEHIGSEWLKRLILTKDKTLVAADYLIDDKPIIKGIRRPDWERIVYTHEYNKTVMGVHMASWEDWPKIREYILRSHKLKMIGEKVNGRDIF